MRLAESHSICAVVIAAVLGSACGPSDTDVVGDGPPPYCPAYVACYEATGGMRGGLDTTYGAMGVCWTTTTATAKTCIEDCKARLTLLRAAQPDAGCRAR